MKSKLVYESLNEKMSFEREKDPMKTLDIGKESSYSHKQILQELAKMGIKINIDFDPSNPPKVLKNIYEIKKFIDNLINLGVKLSDIEISFPDSVCVKGFTVKDNNQVLLHCLTEEDANIITKTLEKFMIDGNNINIDRSSMEPYLYFYKTNDWLKDLKENRKKYNSIK